MTEVKTDSYDQFVAAVSQSHKAGESVTIHIGTGDLFSATVKDVEKGEDDG